MARSPREFGAVSASTAVLAAGLLLASPSAAQEYPLPSEQPEPPTCMVFAGASQDGLQEIRARCWGTGLSLGHAESFRAFGNPELRSTVVELERDGERRVLLLRPFVDDHPLVEDISGTLAVAAGRFSWIGVDGLTLDFDQFGTSGRIGITQEALVAAPAEEGGASAGDNPSGEPIEVSIDQYIALDETRMATAQSAQTEAN